jgi:hypothetical protein
MPLFPLLVYVASEEKDKVEIAEQDEQIYRGGAKSKFLEYQNEQLDRGKRQAEIQNISTSSQTDYKDEQLT